MVNLNLKKCDVEKGKKRKKRQRALATSKSRHAQMSLFDEGPIQEDFFTTDFTQKIRENNIYLASPLRGRLDAIFFWVLATVALLFVFGN